MTYSHAKVRDQQSVGSEDRAETITDRRTDGRTEATALPHWLMRSVKNVHAGIHEQLGTQRFNGCFFQVNLHGLFHSSRSSVGFLSPLSGEKRWL